jgi:hypothetical protein
VKGKDKSKKLRRYDEIPLCGRKKLNAAWIEMLR